MHRMLHRAGKPGSKASRAAAVAFRADAAAITAAAAVASIPFALADASIAFADSPSQRPSGCSICCSRLLKLKSLLLQSPVRRGHSFALR